MNKVEAVDILLSSQIDEDLRRLLLHHRYKITNVKATEIAPGILKEIEGYPGYMACSSGWIFSKKQNKILKPFISNSGYQMISLMNNGVGKKFSVHRLVAQTFLPYPADLNLVVNHLDSNKTNNNVNNLQWVTFSENNLHSRISKC